MTTINSAAYPVHSSTLKLRPTFVPGNVYLKVQLEDEGKEPRSANIVVSRDDLLNLIRTELGVIIIDKTDLPEVGKVPGGVVVLDEEGDAVLSVSNNARTEGLLTRALNYLALNEHFNAHPPVDPAKVETVQSAIERFGGFSGSLATELARAIVAKLDTEATERAR